MTCTQNTPSNKIIQNFLKSVIDRIFLEQQNVVKCSLNKQVRNKKIFLRSNYEFILVNNVIIYMKGKGERESATLQIYFFLSFEIEIIDLQTRQSKQSSGKIFPMNKFKSKLQFF